jgi:diadenosine tetraphosphatase ApaH/serine/threonine PP2A family protein phosphatase
MRVAVIADIHANIRALEAVSVAIGSSGIDRLICLGDIVGYNAEPRECVDWVRDRCDTTVVGNHDVEVAADESSELTHSRARRAQQWTIEQLDATHTGYLGSLPRLVCDPSGLLAAHGCYLNDIYYQGYVTPTMIATNLEAIAERGEPILAALCGHTHVPFAAWLHKGATHHADTAETITWPESASAVLLNPGSVGQPRDRDPRASFAVVDTAARSVEIRRVEYDVEGAARANRRAGLPEALAARLLEGR